MRDIPEHFLQWLQREWLEPPHLPTANAHLEVWGKAFCDLYGLSWEAINEPSLNWDTVRAAEVTFGFRTFLNEILSQIFPPEGDVDVSLDLQQVTTGTANGGGSSHSVTENVWMINVRW